VNDLKVLSISPHTDDAVVASGGSISRILEEGAQVFYLGLSIAEESVPPGFPKNAVESETRLATQELGIDPKKVYVQHFPVRRFNEHRQEILDLLVRLRNEIKPDMVFVPTTVDIHQDHEVVTRESIRAFRNWCSIYGYDIPWNDLYGTKMNVFYELNERHMEMKLKAVSCLKSQIAKKASYLTAQYLRSIAIERGVRIKTEYAEVYEAIRDIRRIH
jgi:LmbE family N-acetylglucosaminyl deacetylase